MTDTLAILGGIGNRSPFSRADLQTIMEECGYQASESGTSRIIKKLLETGAIVRVGRNRYCVADSRKTYHFPHSEFTVSVAKEIIEAHPYLDFRIFELIQMNEFVNHQIAHNIVFVSVEGELEGDVFNTLWDKHRGAVLLKPNADELYRYMSENMIVIIKLPSESPKGVAVFWDTRLEKILVDIAVDKLLGKVVYSGEYPSIYQEAFRKYAIDINAMFRYARRRGAYDRFRRFLMNEAGLKQEVFNI